MKFSREHTRSYAYDKLLCFIGREAILHIYHLSFLQLVFLLAKVGLFIWGKKEFLP